MSLRLNAEALIAEAIQAEREKFEALVAEMQAEAARPRK